jgi:surface polysaccharide O-acyltransferase-like enzyme
MATARYNLSLDRIRIFLTLLVVAHHSALAYVRYGYFDREHYSWSTAPVIDNQQWIGLDLFVLFNDSFFMSLMFFLSGLFVWPSLVRKGARLFLKDRALRLGLPFVVVALSVMPLAYYPSFRLTGSDIDFASFWRNTLTIGPWPTGPAWFIWLLLVFDIAAAGAQRLAAPRAEALCGRSVLAKHHPLGAFLVLVGLSTIGYFAMALPFGTTRWFAVGPLAFQASRPLLYAIYFFCGVIVGAGGIDKGLLSSDGALMRTWWLWAFGAFVSFLFLVVLQVLRQNFFFGLPSISWRIAYCAALVVCCSTSAFAVTAAFLRFQSGPSSLLDRLHDDAYGVYLSHYVFVIWLQYALLGVEIAAFLKAAAVFATALLLSWTFIAAIRKIPGVAQII